MFYPQIYGTGVCNAAVLAVSPACSHFFNYLFRGLGQSSAPWRQVFIAARHRLRQHSALSAARSCFVDAQSEGGHDRGNWTNVWDVLMLWGTDSRQFVAAFISLEEGYWAERKVASCSLSYSVGECIYSQSKQSHSKCNRACAWDVWVLLRWDLGQMGHGFIITPRGKSKEQLHFRCFSPVGAF